MGLWFTFLYLLTAMVTPGELFGPLAEYHAEVVIAGITLICSLFSLKGSGVLRMPQTLAIAGLTAAVALSMLFAGLAREILGSLLDFVPAVAAFFFVAWNCKTKKHLQMVVAVLLCASFYIIYRGYQAQATQNLESMYVISMRNGTGDTFFRTRGLGFLNDPNDLAQFLVGLVPCVFFFWTKGKTPLNVLRVYLPISVLLYGMYLTHSRGAMVALMAGAIVAGRRKIGTLPSAIGGIVVFAGLSAVGWSGGRDVSAASGADRTEAWATGLTLIRAHPLFGVGYLRFAEYFYITAHNTIVVCAAELGFFGFFCWVLLIFSTIHDMAITSAVRPLEAAGPAAEAEAPAASAGAGRPAMNYPKSMLTAMTVAVPSPTAHRLQSLNRPGAGPAMAGVTDPQAVDEPEVRNGTTPMRLLPGDDISAADADLRRMARLMTISFTAFLTAGWFLSRAYTLPLFMNVGIAAVIYRLASSRGLTPPVMALGRRTRISGAIAVGLILLVYAGLRVDSILSR